MDNTGPATDIGIKQTLNVATNHPALSVWVKSDGPTIDFCAYMTNPTNSAQHTCGAEILQGTTPDNRWHLYMALGAPAAGWHADGVWLHVTSQQLGHVEWALPCFYDASTTTVCPTPPAIQTGTSCGWIQDCAFQQGPPSTNPFWSPIGPNWNQGTFPCPDTQCVPDPTNDGMQMDNTGPDHDIGLKQPLLHLTDHPALSVWVKSDGPGLDFCAYLTDPSDPSRHICGVQILTSGAADNQWHLYTAVGTPAVGWHADGVWLHVDPQPLTLGHIEWAFPCFYDASTATTCPTPLQVHAGVSCGWVQDCSFQQGPPSTNPFWAPIGPNWNGGAFPCPDTQCSPDPLNGGLQMDNTGADHDIGVKQVSWNQTDHPALSVWVKSDGPSIDACAYMADPTNPAQHTCGVQILQSVPADGQWHLYTAMGAPPTGWHADGVWLHLSSQRLGHIEWVGPCLYDAISPAVCPAPSVLRGSAPPTAPPVSGVIPWHAGYQQSLSAGLQARVDLSDGHLDVSASAMHIPGLGEDLSVAQTWDSVLAQAGVTTTAGNGWLDSFTPSMDGTLTGTVVYTSETGATWPFTYTGAPTDPGPYSAYTGVPGQPWQLTTSTAGFTLTDVVNGSVRTFDASGRLLSDDDAYHDGDTASYSGAAAVPDSLTNSGGRALHLVAQNGLLSELQSPLRAGGGPSQGQDVTYSYTPTGALLASFTQGAGTADAQTTRFGYTGTLLTTIVTPGGRAWGIQYDAYGRVSQLTSPVSGTLSQVGYTPAYTTRFFYTPGQAQVVEGANTATARQTTYGLSTQGETIAITNALGFTTTLSYDTDHDVTSATDANDHTTAYRYHYIGPVGPSGLGSTGLVTEIDQPAIDGSGRITTGYSYDGNNDLVKTVSANGGLTYYQYDDHHSIITTTQLLSGTVWRGTVNVISPTTGLLLAQVDGRGVTVPAPAQDLTPTATFNVNDAQYERTWGYNAAGDLTSASTPPITTTAGANQPATTTYAPDADGNVTAMTSPNGATTSYAYDHLGRLVQRTQPSVTLFDGTQQAPVTSIGYDGDGNVISSTDGAGDLTQYSYDPLGRLVGTINPVGATTLYTYTATSLSAVQDPAGHVMAYGSDAAGERTSATDPLGTTTQQYGYDGVGNTIAITTPLDYAQPSALSVETRQYDALDEPISATLAGVGESIPTPAQTTIWSYDHDGNVTGQTLPTGDQTQNTFDAADRRTQVGLLTRPPAVQTLTLDSADNLIQQGDFNQRTHMLSVDGDNRLQQQVDTCPTCAPYNAPITTTPTYDPDGNVQTLTAQTGGPALPTIYSMRGIYNALDWRTSQDDGWGPTAYGYDAAGRLRTATLPGGMEVITRTLDAAGRATRVSDTLADPVGGLGTSTSSFTYTPDDLPLTDTLPGGVTEGRTYDADNRLTRVQFTAPGQSAWTYGYAYSPQGRTVTITNGNPNLVNPVWPLSYDALGRLASINTGTQAAWHYDATGNITGTNSVLGGTVTYPQATYAYTYAAIGVLTPANWLPNELVVVTSTQSAGASPAVTTYGYDNSGDTTAITAPNGLSYILNYDALGRLAGVARLDPTNATCCSVLLAYDALGRRASYTAVAAGSSAPPPPFQEVFQYRGTQVSQATQVSQVIVSGTNTTPFTETFVYRPDGNPLELLYQQQDGQGHNQATVRYWYVLDGQGSVVALTDSSGTVVNSYAYDAWGQALIVSEGIPQPLRYRGYWWDGWDNMLSGTKDQGWNGGALPWYALGPREYDPTLGRFLQPDPSSQDGVRSYVYCHDAPMDCTDPSGLEGEPDQSAGADGAGVPGAIGAATGEPEAAPAGVQGAAMLADPETLPAPEESGAGFAGGAAETIAAVNEEVGSEPFATIDFNKGWQKSVPEASYYDKFVYVLMDSDTDTVLKPGITSGPRYTVLSRLAVYARAAQKLRLSLRLTLWRVELAPGERVTGIETRVRDLLEGMEHGMPWENTIAQRLGRPGPGVPFTGSDGRLAWMDDPQSIYHGQLLDLRSGAYYTQDPPYYPPWMPEAAE